MARRSAALRRFFGFLVDDGLRERRPVGGAAAPAASSGRCRGSSTKREVDAHVRAAEDRAASGEPLAVRNLALLELLYGSGLRASELVSLPRGAFAPGQPFLILRGKGGKERLVPISSRAEAAVARWLEHVSARRPVAVSRAASAT